MEPAKKWTLSLFLLVFVAAGCWIGYVGYVDYRLGVEASDWPVTEGTITSARYTGRGKRARLDLRYHYSVDGQSYEGHRHSLRNNRITLRTSERAERYPEGQVVAVHYAPRDPSQSVLEANLYWPGVLFHAVAALLTAAAGSIGLYLVHR